MAYYIWKKSLFPVHCKYVLYKDSAWNYVELKACKDGKIIAGNDYFPLTKLQVMIISLCQGTQQINLHGAKGSNLIIALFSETVSMQKHRPRCPSPCSHH